MKIFNSNAGKIVKLFFPLQICGTAAHLLIYFSLKKSFSSRRKFSRDSLRGLGAALRGG